MDAGGDDTRGWLKRISGREHEIPDARVKGPGQSLVAPLLWVPGVLRNQGAWTSAMKETLQGPALAVQPGVNLVDSELRSTGSAQMTHEKELLAKDQVVPILMCKALTSFSPANFPWCTFEGPAFDSLTFTLCLRLAPPFLLSQPSFLPPVRALPDLSLLAAAHTCIHVYLHACPLSSPCPCFSCPSGLFSPQFCTVLTVLMISLPLLTQTPSGLPPSLSFILLSCRSLPLFLTSLLRNRAVDPGA